MFESLFWRLGSTKIAMITDEVYDEVAKEHISLIVEFDELG